MCQVLEICVRSAAAQEKNLHQCLRGEEQGVGSCVRFPEFDRQIAPLQ